MGKNDEQPMNAHDKIWAYVHEQLSAQETSEIEQEMEHDDAFQSEVETAAWMHGKMKSRYGAPVAAQEELIDKIDAELGDEPAGRSDNIIPMEQVSKRPRPANLFQTAAKILLPLAACLLVLLGVRHQPAGSIASFEANIDMLFRSEGDQAIQRYSRDQFEDLASAWRGTLSHQLATLYRRPTYRILFEGRSLLDVKMTLHELRGGRVRMHVLISSDDGLGAPMEWEDFYESMDACKVGLDARSAEIVWELTQSMHTK